MRATTGPLYFVMFSLASAALWIENNFGSVSFEQIIFHLQFGVDGLEGSAESLIEDFVRSVLVIPLVLAALCVATGSVAENVDDLSSLGQRARSPSESMYSLLGVSIQFMKCVRAFHRGRGHLIFLTLSAFWFSKAAAIGGYIESRIYANYIDDLYVEPVVVPPKTKQNLILIYVESLENSYQDRNLFGRDLLAPLNAATSGWESFGKYRQAYGTGWTIAGIVATQCGIPLRPATWISKETVFNGLDPNLLFQAKTHFLSGAVCLGDVLKQHGYTNIFLGGANPDFAGKGMFLREHGYDAIYGVAAWKELGEEKFSEWGLYDDRLFFHAKKLLLSLRDREELFNMTILTLDTHHPRGYVSETCRKNGVNEYIEIVECTAQLVADFIKFLEDERFTYNTNIVVVGDHLAMVNTVYGKLKLDHNRSVYNKIFSAEGYRLSRDMATHFSLFPTILELLGFKTKSGRAALGSSGFIRCDDSAGCIDNWDIEKIDAAISAPSDLIARFWGLRP